MAPVGAAVAVVGLTLAAGGAGLLLRRTALLAAVLLVVGGLGTTAAAAVLARSETGGTRLLTVTLGLVVPLALLAYPRLRWRHPVDAVALAVIVGTGLTGAAWADGGVVGLTGLVAGFALVVHTWWRIEVTRDRERRALVWMALAVGSTGLAFGIVSFSAETTASLVPALGFLCFGAVGPALYVGATLPDLVDVRGLVVSAVVFAVAAISALSLFVMAVALLDVAGAHHLAVGSYGLVAVAVAMAFHPTQVVLRGVIDQLLFGERPDPLGAASSVAGRIGADPGPALRAICDALVVPYAALVVDDELVASSGVETTQTRSLDLDGAGQLVVGLRPGDLTLTPGDRQVLRLVVPLLTQTLRSRALAREVAESRGRTIAAVEEERRRLRRDLHDGLGPRLSGVAFTSDAARNLIRTDPAAAEELVDRLRADTVTAIEEIRRMVYAMRPPALDELGLVPALRQQTAGLRNRSGRAVAVRIAAPGSLGELPAAVEVAAYRIVVEALTNVARHSSSPSAAVRLRQDADGLHVEVTDLGGGPGGGPGDGPGDGVDPRPDGWPAGVGLSSMRERATELGGTLEAGPGRAGGRVAALLPIA